MNWFDIVKGKFISKRILKEIKKSIESVEGVTVEEIVTSRRTQHLKYKCVYEGEDSPDGKPVKFVITTGGRNLAKVDKIRPLMRKNVKKALEKKNVFIGDW